VTNLKEKLHQLFLEETSLTKFIAHKEYAKLGDALVNFIYSLAKSLATTQTTGTKVSDSILTQAYKNSLWFEQKTLMIKGNKGKIADGIEALILYFWVAKNLSLNELIEPLSQTLKFKDLSHPRVERIVAIQAFQKLLNFLFMKQ
jgi:hypothetical protein